MVGTETNTTYPIFTYFNPTISEVPPGVGPYDGEYAGGFTRTGNGSYGTTIEITNIFDPDIFDRVAYEKHFDPFRTDAPIGGWFYTVVPVPEPTTLALLILGLAVVGFSKRNMQIVNFIHNIQLHTDSQKLRFTPLLPSGELRRWVANTLYS